MRRWLPACLFVALTASAARADKLVLVAGGGDGGDGVPALQVKLDKPFGVDADRDGNLWFVDYDAHTVRTIDGKGVVRTVAGTGKAGDGGDGGPAAKATLNHPHNLAVAPDGSVYIADTSNNKVRKIDRSGVITTVAGTGKKGFSGDGGPATKADCGGIYCVAIDPKGERLYLVDLDNRRVRMVDLKTGVITTVAGNGQKGVPEDGADAKSAPLTDPRAVAADDRGNVYVLERGGDVLRVVDAAGKIRTLVKPGTLKGPKHLCIDRDGGVIIADAENHVVRKYQPKDGSLTRIAGTGKAGTAGLDGPPDKAELNRPHGVFVHPQTGVLYIADSWNGRILKVER
jgi:DNA-binding beta-propeller fold protein YncE